MLASARALPCCLQGNRPISSWHRERDFSFQRLPASANFRWRGLTARSCRFARRILHPRFAPHRSRSRPDQAVRDFVFYTNYQSEKARHLEKNPRAGLVIHWKELERQIRIDGMAEKVSREESARYFHSRPIGSQLGAWVSHQSDVIDARRILEARLSELEERFAGQEIPCPPHWGGYRVKPERIEFWQGRPNRLHDRFRYTRDGESWRIERLAP